MFSANYLELLPNAPDNAASTAFSTLITISITFFPCSVIMFLFFLILKEPALPHRKAGPVSKKVSGVGVNLTSAVAAVAIASLFRAHKLNVLVGYCKCGTHCGTLGKAHPHLGYVALFEVVLVLRALRLQGCTERPEVAEPHAFAVLERKDYLFLKRGEHRLHVVYGYGTLTADVCGYLLKSQIRIVLDLRVEFLGSVLGVLALDYIVINHGNLF